MKTFNIAVIAGDGIGKEVVPESIRVLEAAGRRFDFRLHWHAFDWSCETYAQTGKMMPDDGLRQLRPFNAIFLGAVGHPSVPDHVSLWGLLIPIRRNFRQYVNLRPVRLFEGTEDEMAVQQTVFTRRGVNRVLRFAFELARKRKKHLTSATKSNGIIHTMPFWDECFHAMAANYPDIRVDQFHIDILTAHFVRHPDWFDVVVGSNLFGDILSDLGPAVVGSIGIAPSANLNPEHEFPSMFEPVHGSAPDIAGRGIANPIGQIWSGAMMLRHLGVPEAADSVENAIVHALQKAEVRTPDIGGNSTTADLGASIAALVRQPSKNPS